jgi:hypothetical protein
MIEKSTLAMPKSRYKFGGYKFGGLQFCALNDHDLYACAVVKVKDMDW